MKGRKTGGRKVGSRNKRDLALELQAKQAAEKIAQALGEKAFGGDSHALLMTVYKDPSFPMDMRLDAAKAAIRFEKPPLANVDNKGNTAPNYIAVMPQGCDSAAEWLERFGHLKTPEKLQN